MPHPFENATNRSRLSLPAEILQSLLGYIDITTCFRIADTTSNHPDMVFLASNAREVVLRHFDSIRTLVTNQNETSICFAMLVNPAEPEENHPARRLLYTANSSNEEIELQSELLFTDWRGPDTALIQRVESITFSENSLLGKQVGLWQLEPTGRGNFHTHRHQKFFSQLAKDKEVFIQLVTAKKSTKDIPSGLSTILCQLPCTQLSITCRRSLAATFMKERQGYEKMIVKVLSEHSGSDEAEMSAEEIDAFGRHISRAIIRSKQTKHVELIDPLGHLPLEVEKEGYSLFRSALQGDNVIDPASGSSSSSGLTAFGGALTSRLTIRCRGEVMERPL